MLTDRKSAVLAGDCWSNLVQCSAVLALELEDATGDLFTAHNQVQHIEGPLQALDAAIDANDLAEIRVARDQLRAQQVAALRCCSDTARDIVNRMGALKRALDETTHSARVLANTYADTGILSTEELDALAAGVSAGVALAAAPGTKINFRGVTLSTGKPA